MPRPRSDTNPNSSPSRRQQHHPSVRALDAETVEEIAAAAVSRGGSDDLVRDQLLHATVRRSHNPVPVVADVDAGHDAHVQQIGAVPIASARESNCITMSSVVGLFASTLLCAMFLTRILSIHHLTHYCFSNAHG